MLQIIGSFGAFMRAIWLPWMLFWGFFIAFNFYLGYKEKNRKPGALSSSKSSSIGRTKKSVDFEERLRKS